MKLNLVYFGTPDFSALVLEKIITDKELKELVNVTTVITQPDKPVGRKKIITPSPVKSIALQYSVPVFYDFDSFSSMPHNQCSITDTPPDLALVFAYGYIIPKEILSIPKYGFWNIHPSLLPKYRGASPIAYPLALGETKTGVSLIQMDEKMDHGPIIDQIETIIRPHETRKDLETRFADLGFEMVKKIITQKNITSKQPQNHASATFTRSLKKNDGYIPWIAIKKAMKNEPIEIPHIPAFFREYIQKYFTKEQTDLLRINSGLLIFNLYRALFPWPGLWTIVTIKGREIRMKITRLKFEKNKLLINKVLLEGKPETNFIHIAKIL